MLCLIQCGETDWDRDQRLHGSTDLPLSDAGRLAVTEDVARLHTDRVAMIHHPPDDAATSTAQIAARRLSARTSAVAELSEPNLGLLEGLTLGEFAERYPSRHRQWEDDPMTLEPPEGERLSDAASRIYEAIARLLKKSRSDEVVIVLHPLATGMLRCWLGGRRSNDLWALLEGRPRIERYALTTEQVSELETAAGGLQAHE